MTQGIDSAASTNVDSANLPLEGIESDDYDIACSACWGSDTEEIGVVVKGYFLIRVGTQYVLMYGNGHQGDEILVLDSAPTPQPGSDELDEKYNNDPSEEARAYWKTRFSWYDRVEAVMGDFLKVDEGEPLNIRLIWEFVQDCIEAGYDPNGDYGVCTWLYDHMGKIYDNRKTSHTSVTTK